MAVHTTTQQNLTQSAAPQASVQLQPRPFAPVESSEPQQLEISEQQNERSQKIGHSLKTFSLGMVQRHEEEDDLQMKPMVQRHEEEEDLQMKPMVQRHEEEEDNLQMKPTVQRHSSKKDKSIQRQMNQDGSFEAEGNLESRLNANQSGGTPLPADVQSFMAPRFGYSFENIRVHTGNEAVQMNQDLHAQAFTRGNHVYFNEGKYSPNSSSGKELLAHELTHTIQQTGGSKLQRRVAGTDCCCSGCTPSAQPTLQRRNLLHRKLTEFVQPSHHSIQRRSGGCACSTCAPAVQLKAVQLKAEHSGSCNCSECGSPQVQTKIQTKLTVGAPGDPYEQEADRMAAQVMKMAQPKAEQSILHEHQEEIAQATPNQTARRVKSSKVQRQVELSPTRVQQSSPTIIQRHSSWEHSILGDLEPEQLDAITVTQGAKKKQGGTKEDADENGNVGGDNEISLNVGSKEIKDEAKHALAQELDRLIKWQNQPPTAGDVNSQNLQQSIDPEWGVRLVTINQKNEEAQETGAKTVMTYGELNTLADYFGEVEQLYKAAPDHLNIRLQTIRKQRYIKLSDLYNELGFRSASSTFNYRKRYWKGADYDKGQILDEVGINADSKSDGNLKADEKYFANLARNACHFAPQSWYRWKEYHTKAIAIAQEAHAIQQENNPKQNSIVAAKSNEAWVLNGFGDHYLQDSFAGGHLINKTLVMQWFVEWIREQRNQGTVFNVLKQSVWDKVKTMTVEQQPGIAGMDLYDKPDDGVASDPQTAFNQENSQERFNATGLQANSVEAASKAYQDYMVFLDSGFIQSCTKDLHDKYCKEGLWVGSDADSRVFKIYGDEAMLTGGEGVKYSAETAKMSRIAIESTLQQGQPDIKAEDLMKRFPNKVEADGKMASLQDWQTSDAFKQTAIKVFKKVEDSVKGKAISTVNLNLSGGAISSDMGQSELDLAPNPNANAVPGEKQNLASGATEVEPVKRYVRKIPGAIASGVKAAANLTIDVFMAMPPPMYFPGLDFSMIQVGHNGAQF
jgi:Domain of unknown function (DUF4157)